MSALGVAAGPWAAGPVSRASSPVLVISCQEMPSLASHYGPDDVLVIEC